jgi:hypothetical protein
MSGWREKERGTRKKGKKREDVSIFLLTYTHTHT